MHRNKFKISLVQHDIDAGDPRKTAHRLFKRIKQALAARPALIMLPEVFLGGPARKAELPEYARCHDEFIIELRRLATAKKTCFYGSIIENYSGRFFNTAIFVSPGNPAPQRYRKNHLFHFDNEHDLFSAGRDSPLFKTPWGKAAPLVCYDIRFPELLRKMTFQGARFSLVCAQWPESRREHWLALLRARAIENQIFVIACNRTGVKNHMTYSGDSCVISPWGDFLHLQKRGCTVGTCSVDFNLVEEVRRDYPFLKDANRRRIRFDI
jgi:predicted amidohydrolase